MTRTACALFVAGAALSGCGSPTHLQYDHGRAYARALDVQADLSRASVAAGAYPLTGTEGLALRTLVTEESTDAEEGQAEFIESFQVE